MLFTCKIGLTNNSLVYFCLQELVVFTDGPMKAGLHSEWKTKGTERKNIIPVVLARVLQYGVWCSLSRYAVMVVTGGVSVS